MSLLLGRFGYRLFGSSVLRDLQVGSTELSSCQVEVSLTVAKEFATKSSELLLMTSLFYYAPLAAFQYRKINT